MLEQAVPVSFMDEGPMVAAGVPALGFATRYAPGTRELVWNSYHAPGDTLETQSAEVLNQSGRIAEALVRQLMTMTTFPDEAGPYVYFADTGRVLRGPPLWLVFVLFVALFFAASVVPGGGLSGEKVRGWVTALPHLLGLWLPLLASVVLLYVFVAIGLMDKYHLYPATSKDEPLFQPRWPAVVLYLLGLVVLIVVGRWLAARFRPGPSVLATRQIRSLALLVVGLAGVYVLLVNPFSLLFMVPLLFWLLIGGRRGPGFALDVTLFLLGGLLVYVLFYFFGFVILRNDFAILWFLMMMFSIGMISFPTAVAVTAIIGAGLSLVVRPPGTRQPAG
jgi:hypothetical protein